MSASHCLDIAPALSAAERQRLDLLAVSRGATAEGMAAAAVKRLLARSARKPHVFRLTMPEAARQRLTAHAEALGCAPAELAAFLFSRKSQRAGAVIKTEGRAA